MRRRGYDLIIIGLAGPVGLFLLANRLGVDAHSGYHWGIYFVVLFGAVFWTGVAMWIVGAKRGYRRP
jgi:hypothetical protein